jgi:hypothetical protein
VANFVPPYTTVAYSVLPFPLQGTGIPHEPIPNDLYGSYLRRAPASLVQTMAYTNPAAHRITSTSHILVNSKYEAIFAKLKEDLPNMMKTKLGVDIGSFRLYQKPYTIEFDFVSCPTGWRVPDFVKFSGDDNRTTWEHISRYIAVMLCLFSCL